MTTNQQRAAEEIRRVDGDHSLGAAAIAEALDDAGLLAPDHPEPRRILSDGSPMWVGHAATSIGVDDGLVYIDGALLTPDHAKEEAAMILAAATHAEKEKR